MLSRWRGRCQTARHSYRLIRKTVASRLERAEKAVSTFGVVDIFFVETANDFVE